MLLHKQQQFRRQYYHHYCLPFLLLIPTVVLSFQIPLPFPSSSSCSFPNIPSPPPPANNHKRHGNHNTPSSPLLLSIDETTADSLDSTPFTKIYFDLALNDVPLGRIAFLLAPPARLPLHADNFLSLVASRRLSVDPKATYRGCTFRYSPSDVQDGSARYRWGHTCEGYGRSGLADRERGDCSEGLLRECRHGVYGGVYYGMSYGEVVRRIEQGEGDGEEKEAVLLTVPYGGMTSKFSVVRVSESPREWGERLLLNSVVLGYLDCGDGTSLDVLRRMARQRVGPPKIVDCGIIQ
ncbi:hypothetical protein ACHAW6_002147 [Cyclotella cf. meneghiniana]